MPRESLAAKKVRGLEILNRLKLLYPDATCSLDYETTLQLMVATMLAAQCTDERVNKVTPALFKRYPDAAAFASADLEELEGLVKSTGFYRNKAKNIRLACQRIMEVFGGEVPRTMEDLTSLAGVARKTANVVSSNGHGVNLGFTVDTHVTRLMNRMGFTKHQDAVKIERDLMKVFPQAEWENMSIHLIYHGRAICDARKPLCEQCDLFDLCASAGKAYVKPRAVAAKKVTATKKTIAKKSVAKKKTTAKK
ncbi:endonuclease III [filamentous cyanobacterium LEGE 11480]|uniref:Endonuclease III n=1 Tax=Romeriopsis navalis LEGE 11480 TaxID=2777977 RepID=A0A928VMM4_9CYAN|nr:endonuclease III [Romeriopsis navalis]MBE9029182.1 endonuclease III [Romeriopsis navalis LEGE 11480]